MDEGRKTSLGGGNTSSVMHTHVKKDRNRSIDISFLDKLEDPQFVIALAGALIVIVFLLWVFFGYHHIWVPGEISFEAGAV